MLSRIFWIGLAGIALIGGMIMQDGNGIFSWGDDADHRRSVAERVEARVDAAIDRSFDEMQVVTADGQEIEVPAETKRALAGAVGELVKAETDLAMLRVREGTDQEIAAANARRDRARAEVDTLKNRIERLEQSANAEGDAIGQEVRQQIRDEVRAEIRDAVRN